MNAAPLTLCVALAMLAGQAWAQGIAPRNADPVQPRQADPVLPRSASERPPPVSAPPISAPAVTPRSATPVNSTAVQGTNPKAWRWQSLGDTEVAGDGVARGSQLRDIRCAGLACRVYQDSAGAWTIRAEGGFPEMAGRTFNVMLMNSQTQRLQTDSRQRGVFSDGNFWDQIDTWRLPAGSYAVFYHWPEQDKVFAAIAFDVRQAPARPSNSGGTGGAAPLGKNQQAINAAQQNQRCLAMAATNPDIRCEPAR